MLQDVLSLILSNDMNTFSHLKINDMNKSKVMTLAHSVKSHFPTFADALRFAWAKVKISTKLAKGLCFFTFTKKSTGEERDALGTTNFDYINYEYKNYYYRTKWYLQTFWDTNKNDWRCLDVRTLNVIHW
jgi:hypothetical protein